MTVVFTVRPGQGNPSGLDLGDMLRSGVLGTADSAGRIPDAWGVRREEEDDEMRMQVANRLTMAKAGVTARIPAKDPENVAWVAVYPVDDGFMVFTVEIPEGLAGDSECFGEESIARRRLGTVRTVDEVDQVLLGLGVDPDDLDAPWHNDYPL
ncbi:hypothetical protein [Streptomyces sp. NPDC002054]|uniref:hypothetical protein n=1 Tax=Streptomyces sp. NPDC002054 TaxID=3154663 RepID=UPI00331966FF